MKTATIAKRKDSENVTQNQIKNAKYALGYAMGKNHPGQIANRLVSQGVPEKIAHNIVDEHILPKREKSLSARTNEVIGYHLPDDEKEKIARVIAVYMNDEP